MRRPQVLSIPYLSWNGSYNFTVDGRRMQVFGVINNLLDADPPPLAVAALIGGGNPYDFIGRTFKVGARFT